MTDAKKVNVTIYPEKAQWEQLAALSEITGIPMSVYVRQGIDQIIAQVEHELTQFQNNKDKDN